MSVLCSASLHLASVGMCWEGDVVETGMATGVLTSNPMHIAYITILPENMSKPPSEAWDGQMQALENTTTTPLLHRPEDTDVAKSKQEPTTQQQEAVPSGYLSAGRLTRAPRPVTDIDLNDPALNNLAFTGELELTLLIDVDGTVANVVIPVQSGSGENFANHIAERFRHARFSPGEIDGKRVRSEMKIKVVSEDPTADARQQ
jgi:hypothetical protein